MDFSDSHFEPSLLIAHLPIAGIWQCRWPHECTGHPLRTARVSQLGILVSPDWRILDSHFEPFALGLGIAHPWHMLLLSILLRKALGWLDFQSVCPTLLADNNLNLTVIVHRESWLRFCCNLQLERVNFNSANVLSLLGELFWSPGCPFSSVKEDCRGQDLFIKLEITKSAPLRFFVIYMSTWSDGQKLKF